MELRIIILVGVAVVAAFLFGAWARYSEEGKKFWRAAQLFRPTRAKLVVLLAFFVLLTMISAAQMYSAHSLAVEEENVITLSNYRHTGRYEYVAKLKPNEFYENRSTLRPGEGVLYIKLVENIDVAFYYTFTCDRPASITIDYDIDMSFEAPEKWAKSFTVASESSIESTGRVAEFSAELPVDLPWLDNLRRKIEEETGTSSSTYNLRIRPTIHTIAETDVGAIDENFVPELVMSFRYRAPEGDYIAVSGLENRSSGAIRLTERIVREEVVSQRRTSYAMMAVALAGLALTGWGFVMTKPPKPEKPVEEIIAPFEEAIMEVAKEPSYRGQVATVTMKSLEDLAAVAEGLGKPILYLKMPPRAPGEGSTHVFYVLDGSVRYEYGFKSRGGGQKFGHRGEILRR